MRPGLTNASPLIPPHTLLEIPHIHPVLVAVRCICHLRVAGPVPSSESDLQEPEERQGMKDARKDSAGRQSANLPRRMPHHILVFIQLQNKFPEPGNQHTLHLEKKRATASHFLQRCSECWFPGIYPVLLPARCDSDSEQSRHAAKANESLCRPWPLDKGAPCA
jgi:hypothetical protein